MLFRSIAEDPSLWSMVVHDRNTAYKAQFKASVNSPIDLQRYIALLTENAWGSKPELAAMARYANCEVHVYRNKTGDPTRFRLTERFTPKTNARYHMVASLLERVFEDGRTHYDVLVPKHIHKYGPEFWSHINSELFANMTKVNKRKVEMASQAARNIGNNAARKTQGNNLPQRESNIHNNSNNFWSKRGL